MSEIVNLRRARKEKARTEKEKTASVNRAKHGVAKREHDLQDAKTAKAKHHIDAHKLDDE